MLRVSLKEHLKTLYVLYATFGRSRTSSLAIVAPMSPRRKSLALLRKAVPLPMKAAMPRNHTECVTPVPVKDTRPAHSDSRPSGWATYPESRQPASRSQDEEPQGSMSGTGPNPNASGRAAREVRDVRANGFEDSNGYGQMDNELQCLDGYQPLADVDPI